MKTALSTLDSYIDGFSNTSSGDPRLRNVIVIVVVLYLCTRVFRIGTGHLLALALIVIILWKFQTDYSTDVTSFNETMEYKLRVIGGPSHFHFDTDLIEIFYNILPWRKLNANNYDSAIEAINNVLIIEEDTGHQREYCVNNYEVARDKAKLALNLVHGFIYSIEHQLLKEKLDLVLTRLQVVLEKHLDIIRGNCDRQEVTKGGPNYFTRYIEDAKGVKAFDDSRMTPFDFF